MISSIHQALLHSLKRNDIIAIIAGNRVHNGSGNNGHQKWQYEKNIQSHDGNMVRQFSEQSKLKFEKIGSWAQPIKCHTRIGSTTSGMPWL